MKTENQTKENRRDFFRDLYTSAANAAREKSDALDRCMRQYRGSTEIDGSDEEALTVRNITYEIVESQVSSNIPMPKADAVAYSDRRNRNAESIERLCRSVRNRLPFEELNDIDERYTYIYGGSVWYVEWENDVEYMGEVGAVKVYCLSPKDFIPQPGIYSVGDMEYCFLRFSTTRGELPRKYGVSEESLEKCDVSYEFGSEMTDGDAVTVVVCFYKDDDGDIGRYVFSGELTLSDIPKYYHRKALICKKCGKVSGECVCGQGSFEEGNVDREVLRGDMLLQDGINLPAFSPVIENGRLSLTEKMKRTTIPYYVPKVFPIVIRKNTSGEGELFGQSDCDYIRPEQQAINKIESRILQKLLRAGITPIVPEDASISLNNSVFGQIIKLKPGESISQYGKVDTTPDISQDVAEAERLYDHAKRIIGISDAYQGIDTASNESGYAKQLRISQATGRLQSKKKMKDIAYASLDKIIFGLYLAFADEPRRLTYKDTYGRVHRTEFNRYDFIEYDPKSGNYYYDDAYMFSTDPNSGADYQRETMWERNLDNLRAGTLGDPNSPVTLLRYWQCQEMAHYPNARENAEYFKERVERLKQEAEENDQNAV